MPTADPSLLSTGNAEFIDDLRIILNLFGHHKRLNVPWKAEICASTDPATLEQIRQTTGWTMTTTAAGDADRLTIEVPLHGTKVTLTAYKTRATFSRRRDVRATIEQGDKDAREAVEQDAADERADMRRELGAEQGYRR